MKTLKSLFRKICLTFTISLFFIGCSDLSSEKNWTVLNGKGKIVISTNFSDTKARTVLPTPFSSKDLGYKWVLYSQTSSSVDKNEVKFWEDKEDEDGNSISAYNNMLNDDYILFDVGSYIFTLVVYNGENKKVLEGSDEFTINASQNNILSFDMKEASGTDVAGGSFLFKLKWSELGVVDKVQATLLKSDGSSVNDDFTNVTLNVIPADDKTYEYVEFNSFDYPDLPSGYYILKLELKQNIGDETTEDNKTINTYTCIIYVAPGLCSEGEFLLENLAKLYTISYELNEGDFENDITIVTSYNKYSSFELPTPNRWGYAFTGWYTDSQLTSESKVENTSNYKISSDTTLYASWIELGSVREYPINDWYTLMAYVESKSGYESVDAYITGNLNVYQTLPLYCPVNIIAVESATLLRQSGFSDSMIKNTFSLTLDGVTLDGNNIENASSLIKSSADITLNNCIIKNNKNSESGGAIYVGSGKVIATNVTIENCSAKCGGAVYINEDCSFEMSSSTIQNNTAVEGAGVHVAGDGIFTMNNGTISGNSATSSDDASVGGGVYVAAKGTFNMKGGSIINNSVNYKGTSLLGGGGGVAVNYSSDSAGVFNMTGGIIEGNTAIGDRDYGSGVFVNGLTTGYYATFKISGSAVVKSDNDVYLKDCAKITVTGALTGTTPVATITPSSYTNEKQVIQVENISFDSVVDKFAVTPKLNDNGDYETWSINKNGEIVSDSGVVISYNIPTRFSYEGSVGLDGDYVYFGEWPQTIKGESVIITDEIDERGYYKGSDGCYYAKSDCISYNEELTFSNGNNVIDTDTENIEDDLYFKVEPIKWRIVSNSYDGNKCLLICENILTANVAFYDDSMVSRELNGLSISVNNYKYSNIRAYLNSKKNQYELDGGIVNDSDIDWTGKGFYNIAFNDEAKSYILNTNIGSDYQDKIFLLSKEESSSYFGEIVDLYNSNAIRYPTDFAKANFTYQEGDDYGGYWWLRSAEETNNLRVYDVSDLGNYEDYTYVYYAIYGIVPCLCVNNNVIS